MNIQNTPQQTYPYSLCPDLWVLGNYYFNLYLVKGRHHTALVEMGVSAIVDSVIAQLDTLKISPDYLILTHPHSDHITGMNGLREQFPNAEVVAGSGAKEFIEHPKALPMMVKEDQFMSKALAAQGIESGRAPIEAVDFPENPIIVDRTHTIDLGGVTLKCIRVEGHAPGNIVVHIPEQETLILSDALGFHYPERGFCPLFFTGYAAFLATLDRLASLNSRIICPAHQGPLTGEAAKAAFSRARQAAMDLNSSILKTPGEKEPLIASLFERYYQDEFTLYSPENIRNCMQLLVKRVRQHASDSESGT